MTAMEPPATKHTHEVQDSSEEHVVGHGSSSAEGSTFVCASGDHILAKGNTKFEIKRETAKRSQLLSDILSFDEKLVSFESFKLPANASTFEAWVTHVENREHLKRKSISYYSRVQQLLKAVAVSFWHHHLPSSQPCLHRNVRDVSPVRRSRSNVCIQTVTRCCI